jgi:hypothetical protein
MTFFGRGSAQSNGNYCPGQDAQDVEFGSGFAAGVEGQGNRSLLESIATIIWQSL